jgi:hypothetical protein
VAARTAACDPGSALRRGSSSVSGRTKTAKKPAANPPSRARSRSRWPSEASREERRGSLTREVELQQDVVVTVDERNRASSPSPSDAKGSRARTRVPTTPAHVRSYFGKDDGCATGSSQDRPNGRLVRLARR